MSTNHKRGAEMDRLLRGVLKPASHAAAGDCPEAGLLAAFVEGNVSEPERAALDEHVVHCGRCQETLAVLGRDDAPQEAEATGAAWFTWVTRPRLRWLVPITGLVTVAVFFVATRSLIAPGYLAPPAEVAQLAQAAPPASPIPPVEAVGERDKAVPPQASPAAVSAVQEAPARRQAKQVPALKQAADAASVPAPLGGRAAVEKQAAAESPADLAARVPTDETRARPAAAPAAGQLAAAPARSDATARMDAAQKMADANAFEATAKREELRSVDDASPVVLAPGGAVRWRFAAGGQVWRSADAGSTWHAQASGVSADLFAGSAPSPASCWAVGAGGTVLLTQDGERWERRPFPLAVDLTAVEARNARVATVTARDGRRFATLDAGATWSPR